MFRQTEEKDFSFMGGIGWPNYQVKDSITTHYTFTALRPINNRTYPLILKPIEVCLEFGVCALSLEFGEEDRTQQSCTGPTGRTRTWGARSWRTGRSDSTDRGHTRGVWAGCYAERRMDSIIIWMISMIIWMINIVMIYCHTNTCISFMDIEWCWPCSVAYHTNTCLVVLSCC